MPPPGPLFIRTITDRRRCRSSLTYCCCCCSRSSPLLLGLQCRPPGRWDHLGLAIKYVADTATAKFPTTSSAPAHVTITVERNTRDSTATVVTTDDPSEVAQRADGVDPIDCIVPYWTPVTLTVEVRVDVDPANVREGAFPGLQQVLGPPCCSRQAAGLDLECGLLLAKNYAGHY
jgi:hypothetical protein